jgi:hypothetical protein
MTMVVDIDVVERATIRVLKHLRDNGIKNVNVDDDFYWFIPKEHRHDMYQEPHDFTVGQLSFDWDNVRKIADGASDPVGLALSWIGSILTAVGEQSGV